MHRKAVAEETHSPVVIRMAVYGKGARRVGAATREGRAVPEPLPATNRSELTNGLLSLVALAVVGLSALLALGTAGLAIAVVTLIPAVIVGTKALRGTRRSPQHANESLVLRCHERFRR